MKIAVPKERRPDERRVSATPETVKKYAALGFEIAVERGAGEDAAVSDDSYREAGATLCADAAETLAGAGVVLKVRPPLAACEDAPGEIEHIPPGAIVVGALAALRHRDLLPAYARARLTVFSLELLPRITRAQSMDVLSSQSNLAGYKAVLDAAGEFGRALPMMMTAAGTIAPARVLVLGTGVAGLQAIATARRLGAIVSAYDVRPAAREQVESLGARFVEVDPAAVRDAETSGGYAREMSDAYRRKQREILADTLRKHDIAICAASIPDRPAPLLIDEDMVDAMRAGSVIVDLSVEQGGNCALSEIGRVAVRGGVRIVGHANVPGRLAVDASAMYAKNLFNFIAPMAARGDGGLDIDWGDELIEACLVARDGRIVHAALADERPAAEGG